MFKKRIYRQSEKLPLSISVGGPDSVAISPIGYSYGYNDSEVVLNDNLTVWTNHFKKFYSEEGTAPLYLNRLKDEFISNLFPVSAINGQIALRNGGVINLPAGHTKIFIECPVLIRQTKPEEGDAFITSITYGAPSVYDTQGKTDEQIQNVNEDFLKIKTGVDYPAPTSPKIVKSEDAGNFKIETFMYKAIIPIAEITKSGLQRKNYGETIFFNGYCEKVEDYLDFSTI